MLVLHHYADIPLDRVAQILEIPVGMVYSRLHHAMRAMRAALDADTPRASGGIVMTTERDPRTRIVLSWLREDAYQNPERMLLRALDEVDATPQRRSSWPARRSSEMGNLAKVLVATAAVVAVAVVGINLLPGSQTGVGGPRLPPPRPHLPRPRPLRRPATPSPTGRC